MWNVGCRNIHMCWDDRAIPATTQGATTAAAISSAVVEFCFTKSTSLDNTDLKQRVPPGHHDVSGPSKKYQSSTTFSGGCLGSHNDEERSEVR